MKQLITILLLHVSITVNATTYYVSNSGDDSNSGLTQVLAWQTLDKVNSFTFSEGDQILFKRGDTFYGTLRINQSGTSGNPITFGAYGFGDKPVITGLKSVTAWTDLGFNVWQSSSAVSALNYSNIVVINDANTPMGRYPNSGYLTYQSHSGTTSITSSSLTGSPNWTGAELVSKKNRWVIDRNPITAQSGGTLTFTSGSYIALTNSLNYTPTDGFGLFIQNDTRTLDVQNEWYYNPSTKKLSVYSTTTPTNVQIATLDTLIVLPIYSHDYTFQNITFTGCNDAVVNINSVSNLTFDSCTFQFNYDVTNESNYGSNSDNLIIQNCEFYDISNSAIKKSTEATNSKILNNTFKRIGMIPGAGGSGDGSYTVTSLFGEGTQVKYNTVDSVAYNGIDINTDNINVSYNVVSNYCLIKDDGAGIYSYEAHVGDTVAYNTIYNGGVENSEGSDGGNHSFGIYLDDYSSGFYVHHNNIYNAGYAGIYAHNAKDCKIEYNTIYNPIGYMGLYISTKATDQTTTGMIVKHNTIVVGSAMDVLVLESWKSDLPTFGSMDSNFYARPIYDNLTIRGTISGEDFKYSLGTWRAATGYEINSNKSPQPISNSAQLSFYFNPNNYDSTLSLGGSTYVDMANTSYTGDVVLQPYSSLVLINTGTLTTPTITWANPSAIIYGTALSSTQLNASTTVAGTFSYNYSSGTVLNAGSYTLTTIFTPTDGTTYSTAAKSVILVVNKATATLSYSGLTKTYNGSPQSPTIITSPFGLTGVSTIYNGVGAVPTNAGSYTVVTGLSNINYSATTITNTFTINKAIATITVTSNINQIADGNPKPISATTNPSGLALTVTYDGSPTAPSAVGSYSVHIEIVNGNYSGSKDVTLEITAPSAAITITNLLQTYDGTAKSVTITTIPGSLPYDITYNGLSVSSVTNAGSYTVIATLNDGVHEGADTAILVIQKANPVLAWINPQPVQAGTQLSSTQLNATSNIEGSFVYSYPLGTVVTEGVLPITATFTPSNSNYNTATISVLLNIYGNPFTNFIIGDYYQNK